MLMTFMAALVPVLLGALLRPQLTPRTPPPRLSATSSRSVAHGVLLRCFKDDAFADRALSSALSKSSLAGADRALAAEIVYGVLRHGRALDFALTQLTSLERASLPTTLALRVGAYELMHLRTPEYAAVNEAVSLVKPEAQRRFVNGVLRTLARRRDSLAQPTANASVSELSALAIRTTTPEWLLRELLETFGNRLDEVEAWALATQQRPPLTLRVNRLRASPTELSASLRSVGATIAEGMPLEGSLIVEAGAGEVSALPGFDQGAFSVQDIGAQCVAWLAAPPPDGITLDLCAAPGGKTAHLAELMGDRGEIISVELHERKAALVRETCARLGLSCVRVVAADASNATVLRELLAMHAGPRLADCVVVDAPCSGMGTLRRNPEHRYRVDDPSRLAGLCALQDRLLDAGACCVRPGGTLTFSVCSPLRAETTERVAAFLRRHPHEFERVPVEEDGPLAPFAAEDEHGARTCVRTWTHLHPADSHFACKLRRRSLQSP